MSPLFAIFTFINAWWITLFIVLPFGIKMSNNKPAIEYAAAPQAPRWKKLLLINSCISVVVTLVLALLMHYHAVSLDTL